MARKGLVHQIPIEDGFPHVEAPHCWCRPEVREDWWGGPTLVIHQPADGRPTWQELNNEEPPPVVLH